MSRSQKKEGPTTIVGIDLGTTNSAAAILEHRQPVMIPKEDGTRLLPSVVHRTATGEIVVGQDAEAAKVAMPAHTIAAAKRHLGSDLELRLGSKKLRAEEALALVLGELKTWVQGYLKLTDDDAIEAVITVPAYFAEAQRRAVQRAGQLAGFTVERMINEPTAAALAYGLGRKNDDGLLLVYDLGGGTFDVSLVEMFDGILEVRASHGNGRLGGEDFDWLLAEHLAAGVKSETGADPMADLEAKALLKHQAEMTKKLLSSQQTAEVKIPLLMFHEGQPVTLDTTVERAVFEAMIREYIEETIESVQTVLDEADVHPKEVKDVLLVGGSTRIPLVRQMLRDVFGREPLQDVDPDEAVALGAAVQAGIKSGTISVDTLLATDVAPFSLGIETALRTDDGIDPGWFSRIIRRNTTIPVRATERYETVECGQTTVDISVYQGEDDRAERNFLLGQFLFEDIPYNPNECESFDVTFTYNLNGLLEVQAVATTTGKKMAVAIHDHLERTSRQAFRESIQRLEDLKQARLWEEQPLPLDFHDDGPLLQESGSVPHTVRENLMPWPEFMENESLETLNAESLMELAGNFVIVISGFIEEYGHVLPADLRRKMKRQRTSLRKSLQGGDQADIVENLKRLFELMDRVDEDVHGDEQR